MPYGQHQRRGRARQGRPRAHRPRAGPATLAGLVTGTGLARPTAHRLAVALEHHRLVARDMQGRFVLGPRLAELSVAAGEDRLLATAGPVLARLRDITGESSQLWRRQGDYRVCVAAAERPSGLRDTIPVGSQLTMRAGSAAQVLLAWEDAERIHRGLQNAAFSAAALSGIRRRGWAQSVGEREQGVASVSAPVRSPSGKIVAAVSVSGPLERLSRQPGRMHAPAVVAAAERLSESLRRAAAECRRWTLPRPQVGALPASQVGDQALTAAPTSPPEKAHLDGGQGPLRRHEALRHQLDEVPVGVGDDGVAVVVPRVVWRRGPTERRRATSASYDASTSSAQRTSWNPRTPGGRVDVVDALRGLRRRRSAIMTPSSRSSTWSGVSPSRTHGRSPRTPATRRRRRGPPGDRGCRC